jgi:hypothetical protein
MSGGLPTERQLAALEQRVLTRIRRRAALRARVASAAAATALIAGAVVLVHPTLGSLPGGTAAGAGSTASDRATADSAPAVVCHRTSAAESAGRRVRLPAHPTPASVAAACRASAASVPAYGSASSAPPSSLVACRAEGGGWQVFPADGDRTTLCARNGLRAG